jgi:DNA-nicking Smr family endonuclease
MAEDKEKKQGFRVIDKRTAAEKTAQHEETKQTQETSAEKKDDAQASPPIPELNFSAFVYSLSTSALVHLGEIPEPVTEKMDKNLPLAKQTIDILGMLQEKTKGNLTSEEENLLNSFLYDLRMRYVKAMD